MNSLRILGAAAVLALALPVVTPEKSYAQGGPPGMAGGGARGGGAAVAGGGRGGGAIGGGGFRAGGGGGGFRAGGAPPGVGAGAGFRGGGAVGAYRGGAGYAYRGGGYRGYRGGGGFIPGAVAGAVIGGAIASTYPRYGYGYGGPVYYEDQYYDDGAVTVAPGDPDAAYCAQTYRSYDPASGTYLGNDGLRHPCP
jgi:hypothetical protein